MTGGLATGTAGTAAEPRVATSWPRLLRDRARSAPDQVALRHKHLGIWQPTTWDQYLEQVHGLCLGLRDLGVGRGDRVAIHSENRPEWVYADLAAEALGAIVVGVYPTNPASQVAHLLGDSAARALVCEDQEQLDKALAVIDYCPKLERIIVIDTAGLKGYDHPAIITYRELVERGRDLAAEDPTAFDALVDATSGDDVACIVYTSGTTGSPKGTVLTQANCLAAARSFAEGLGVTSDDTAVSYLPLCHIAERMWSIHMSLLMGVTISFAESIATVQADIREIAPTFFGAVPRIAEKVQAGVEVRMADAAWPKRKNYQLWMNVGRRLAGERLDRQGDLSPMSRLLYLLGDWFLYRPLRDRLGLRNVRHCLVGAAPPAPELLEWFHAIGLRMVQAYGQTECGGASHMHQGWDIEYGTVGTALPGFRWKLDTATGEVLLAGDGVFSGYWGKPEATAEALRGGWLHTGDQGVVTDQGHLEIVGRIKDIFITSGGKNISPDRIENTIKFSPYVQEAIVVGDGRKHLAALIGIEQDTVAHWAEQQRIPYTTYRDLSEHPQVIDLMGEWIQQVNEELSVPEQIKRFCLLPKELDHEDAELTATQKVRRAVIARRFSDLIEDLYR